MTIIGSFRLPYEPRASKNKMHGHTKQGRIYLHPKARAWRLKFSEQIKQWLNDNGITPPPKGHPVQVMLTSHFPPQGGKGRGHKADAANFVDLTLDAVKDGLGIDDYSFSITATPGETDLNGGYFSCLIEL